MSFTLHRVLGRNKRQHRALSGPKGRQLAGLDPGSKSMPLPSIEPVSSPDAFCRDSMSYADVLVSCPYYKEEVVTGLCPDASHDSISRADILVEDFPASHDLEALSQLFLTIPPPNESSPSSSTAVTSHEPLLDSINKRIESLRKKKRHIKQLELLLSQGKSLNEKQEELLRSKPSILYNWNVLKDLKRTAMEISSMNERRKYLCVSNGFVILCLDLSCNRKTLQHLERCHYEFEPLPIVYRLKLGDQGFPVSMGLFKMGPDACMIGGHEFPNWFKPELSDRSKYGFFYGQNTFECKPSLDSYKLDRFLNLSHCETIKPLNGPKIWPVVEKVGRHIHVIESYCCYWNFPRPPTLPSHEVLDTRNLDHGWTRLSHPHEQQFDRSKPLPFSSTWFSLVVGNRIYLRCRLTQFEVFDTTTQKWECHEYDNYRGHPNVYTIKHIAELLMDGFGRCIGEYRHAAESCGPLYVVIGVGMNADSRCQAAAYLVTPTGQVLWYQRLQYLFGSFAREFYLGRGGTVIGCGGDEEWGTYCAIVPGCTAFAYQEFIFVSTFVVEDYPLAHLNRFPSISKIANEGGISRLPYPVEKCFVNLVVEDWHAFKSEDMGNWYPSRLSACFLEP